MSEVKSAKLLVFLDFDGVFHQQSAVVAERSCRLPLLEGRLRERQRIDVVISTSWRFAN